jgi:hypothetical protein
MEYRNLKAILGSKSADRLEDAVLFALSEARTPEATEALSRLMACLTAAVAHRAKERPGIAARCVSDFSTALEILAAD